MSNTNLLPFNYLNEAATRLQNGSAYTADFTLVAQGYIYCNDRDHWHPVREMAR